MSNHGDELEQLLRLSWERARASWPTVPLAFEPFSAHLRGMLGSQNLGRGRLSAQLESMAVSDLYLACACLQGMPSALQVLETQFMARLPSLLGYLKLPATMLDEVSQRVRIHLLVGTSETRPQFAEYTGRGQLLSWLRVMAVRTALKSRPPNGGTREDERQVQEALLASKPSPELDIIRRRYSSKFTQAVHDAYASLPKSQQSLLRLHVADRLSTTQVDSPFGKNPSTARRELEKALHALFEKRKRPREPPSEDEPLPIPSPRPSSGPPMPPPAMALELEE
ncbi:RNA polymerase subunit sigma-70 [Vitiosangium sp. GDMCC 1.1324]|uniref:RNA polymerase subunit sigma-70 n=1 Tax=Vitiosangium sp. (strain GDMCC 1.1324) TaxID=2138576 RepID=UPI00130DCA92|nr:RNA polymerase subunit sigma-70 [Vitiosangium sp. GDMCC 1.1324]